jgi:ribosome recycling factor
VGDLIRVPTPALTEERRKEMVKLVRSEAEDAKIAIRNIRRDANESLKKLLKDKAISEDDERRTQEEVQKLTDKFVAEVDKLVVEKEKDVMTV